jgi:hypothetical protein
MLAMIDDRPETPDDVMARAFAITPDLSTLQARLLHAADLLEAKLRAAGMFDGPDGREVADLREAATRAAHYDSVVSAWAAHTETMGALGQHLLDAHKPGEVDGEAVAILDGYHVGGRAVVPGEPGETTLQAALRLLKLAKARGAFAAAAQPGATFRSALIDSADAIPDWVDPDEFKGANFEDGYSACVAVLSDGKVRYHWDGGEAEDNLYLRDWAWVAPALDAAYDAGRSDVLSGAVPPTWDQLCDKIRALGLRCYIRGGEGVETALMIDGPAVYYAPDGIHKAPVGHRIADIYNPAVGLFQPTLVDRAVVPFERIGPEVMTIPVADFVGAAKAL